MQTSDTWSRFTMDCGTDDETRQATAYASTGLDGNGGLLHHLALSLLRLSEYPARQENGWIVAQTSSAIAQTTAGKIVDALFLGHPDADDIPSISGVASASTWSADSAQYDLSSLGSLTTWEEQTVAFMVDQAPRLVQTVVSQSVKAAFIAHSREAEPITTPPRSPISYHNNVRQDLL